MSNGSSTPDALPPDHEIDSDELIARIVEYDEALAAGRTFDVKQDETLQKLPSQTQARLLGIFNCLEFLDRVRRRRSEVGGARGEGNTEAPFASPPSSLLRIGRFELVRELGRGGHGVVFLANDPLLRRQVALKVPRPEYLLSPSMGRRFLGEARAVAALDHANILKVYEGGSDGVICYIAQELCTGPSLAGWLRQQGSRLDPQFAAKIVMELARGVEHAHQQGVLHRDLKPANVLLQPIELGSKVKFEKLTTDKGLSRRSAETRSKINTSEDGPVSAGDFASVSDLQPATDCASRATPLAYTPKLADFGIAKVYDEEADRTATQTGTTVGTVAYMSPEQAAGKTSEIGLRSDVYGLGAILYELLAGRAPFDFGSGTSVMETMRRVIVDEPVPPRSVRPGIPPDLEAICLHCLEKVPADRYATAGAIADDLGRFLRGQGVSIRRSGRLRRLLRRVRHQPASTQIGLGAIVLLLSFLVVCLAMIWSSARRSVAEHPPQSAESEYLDGIERVSQDYFDAVAKRGDVKAAVRELDAFLERHQPQPGQSDYRGFEWHYLWRLCHPDLVAKPFPKLFDLIGHKGEVYFVTFSPDGKRIATAGQDHTGRIWDAQTGKLLTTLTGHTDDVNWIAFVPEGLGVYYLTASDDKSVRIWKGDSGKLEAVLSTKPSKAVAVELVICHDGNTAQRAGAFQILCGDDDGRLHAWDFCTRRETQTIRAHAGRIQCIAKTRGADQWLTASSDGTAKEWNSSTWTCTRSHVNDSTSWGGPGICSASCNVDGTLVALGSGKSERIYQHPQTAASGTGLIGSIPVDDLLTGNRWLTLVGPQAGKECVRFYPNQCLLASAARGASGDEQWNYVVLSDVPTQKFWTPCGTKHPPCWCAAFSPDGTRFATAAIDGVVRVWDSSTLPTGTRLPDKNYVVGRSVQAVHYSPDGQRLLVNCGDSDNQVPGYDFAVWDLSGERPKLVLGEPADNKRINSFAGCFSPDGRLIAVDSTEFKGKHELPRSSIRILDAGSLQEIRTLDSYVGCARRILLSPDGKSVVAATGDAFGNRTQLNFWFTTHGGSVDQTWESKRAGDFLATTLSPNGKLLATNRDQVEIYDFPSLKLVAKLPADLGRRAAACFSSDGQVIAVGGNDGTIRLFRPRDGVLLKTLVGDGHAVLSLAFSTDGSRLAAGLDGAARVDLWHVPSAKRLGPLAMPTDLVSVRGLAFAPDGRTLAAAGAGLQPRGSVFLFPLGRTDELAK